MTQSYIIRAVPFCCFPFSKIKFYFRHISEWMKKRNFCKGVKRELTILPRPEEFVSLNVFVRLDFPTRSNFIVKTAIYAS